MVHFDPLHRSDWSSEITKSRKYITSFQQQNVGEKIAVPPVTRAEVMAEILTISTPIRLSTNYRPTHLHLMEIVPAKVVHSFSPV